VDALQMELDIDEDGATDMDRSLTALKAFAVLLLPGLLGTHAGLDDKVFRIGVIDCGIT
jgi:hypothetical protein